MQVLKIISLSIFSALLMILAPHPSFAGCSACCDQIMKEGHGSCFCCNGEDCQVNACIKSNQGGQQSDSGSTGSVTLEAGSATVNYGRFYQDAKILLTKQGIEIENLSAEERYEKLLYLLLSRSSYNPTVARQIGHGGIESGTKPTRVEAGAAGSAGSNKAIPIESGTKDYRIKNSGTREIETPSGGSIR